MGDDGFGPAAVRAFEAEYVVGPDVTVVDIGTPGLDLMPWFTDAERLVLVDTVKSDCAPGTLKVYDQNELLRYAPAARVGPHEPGVKEALLTLELAGRAPREVVLIGVVPQHVGLSLDLTPVVRDMVPVAADVIAATLRRFGVAVQKRAESLPVHDWWSTSQSVRAMPGPKGPGLRTSV